MSATFLAAATARAADAAAKPHGARIWCVSDVHTDYEENLEWCRALAEGNRFRNDVIIVAGDLSNNPSTFRATLQAFVDAFGTVFFTPGNHDLWVKGRRGLAPPSPTDPPKTSLELMDDIREVCKELGVITTPAFAAGAVIAPILSWHHES